MPHRMTEQERELHEARQALRDCQERLHNLEVATELEAAERRRSEEALKRARVQLESALLAAEVGTFVWDAVANRLHGDRNFEALFGISLDEAPPEAFAAAIHPDDRAGVMSLILRTLKTGNDYKAEYRIVAGGRERWVVARGKVERDDEGAIIRFSGVLLDITERRQAEEALREADRRKDEFLATLSHELRNPLAPIRQAITLLKVKNLGNHDAGRARAIIDRQSQHMARLLDDLLDISRITRGVLELRKEPVELHSVIDTALEAARPLIESHRHRLRVDLPDTPVRFEADGLRLAQVISNLLANSAKYTDPGGQIHLQAATRGEEIILRVTDNGIGFSDDMLRRLFEMFSQEQSTAARSQGGLGIGLALVRGLVELHGGQVEARSAGIGQGSEFTVRLPITPAPGRPAEPAGPAGRRGRRRPRRILVADDNKDTAESMGTLLELAGHEVRTVNDGQAALDVGASFEPDVALLDIGMPLLSGYEVAERARSAPWGRRALLIALTGWGQEKDKQRALGAGFDHHLTKPVDQKVLEALLEGDG